MGSSLSEHGTRRLDERGTAAVQTEARRLLHRRLRSGSALDLSERTGHPGRVVVLQTLGRRDELRGVLAVALPERPDTSATR